MIAIQPNQPNIPADEIVGWECNSHKKRGAVCRQLVQSLRVNHLVKKHDIPKRWIGKESDFENSNYSHLFRLRLVNKLVCPHCDQILHKYASSTTDFTQLVCWNKKCPKNDNGRVFVITEFIGIRKKHYCQRHQTNSDKPCSTCKFEKHINKTLVPRLNKIAGEILGK